MADGSIVFETELDNKQLHKDLQKVTKEVDDATKTRAIAENKRFPLKKELEALSPKIEEAKAKLKELKSESASAQFLDANGLVDVKAVYNAGKAYASTEKTIESTGRKLEEQKRKQEESTRAAEEYARQLQAADARIDALNAAGASTEKIAVEQSKANQLDRKWQTEQDKAEAAIAKVKQLEAEVASLNVQKAAQGQALDVGQKLRAQEQAVSDMEQRYTAINSRVEELNSIISTANDTIANGNDKARALRDEMSGAGAAIREMFAGVEKSTNAVGKRITGLVKRVLVFSLITKALNMARQHFTQILKQNSQFTAQVAKLKGAMASAFQPLVSVAVPALTKLIKLLTAVFAIIGRVVSGLFGTSVESSRDAAKAANEQADAIKGVGGAAKQAKRELAGFDEINKLSSDAGGGGGGGGGSTDIGTDFDFLDGIDGETERIAKAVLTIAAGFALWKIASNLPGVLGEVGTTVAGIAMAVGGILLAWDGLKDAWENGVDWGNLAESIGGVALAAVGLYIAFGPLAAGIALVVGGIALLVTGFRDMTESGMNLQNTLMVIGGILAGGLGLAVIAGSIIPAVIAAIAALLVYATYATGHGEELVDGIREAIDGFKKFFTSIFAGDTEGAIEGIKEAFAGLKKAAGAVCDAMKDYFGKFYTWLDEKTNGKLTEIISFIRDEFGWYLDDIKAYFDDVIDGIEQVLNGLVDFIAGVFSGDFDRAWDGVKGIFGGIANAIISTLESAINGIIDGLNYLISKINGVGFTVPDWVPGVGGKKWSPNIKSVGQVSIPRLAQGAVIPPNREFMAVLGDQKHGTNIEAPLSTIQEAVAVELQQQIAAMMAGFEAVVKAIQEKDTSITIGDDAIGRSNARHEERMSIIHGG